MFRCCTMHEEDKFGRINMRTRLGWFDDKRAERVSVGGNEIFRVRGTTSWARARTRYPSPLGEDNYAIAGIKTRLRLGRFSYFSLLFLPNFSMDLVQRNLVNRTILCQEVFVISRRAREVNSRGDRVTFALRGLKRKTLL